MEHVDAELHGWPAAPFPTKDETDANYKRMLDVLLDPANDGAVRAGIASHNLFEVAWAVTQADRGAPATGSRSRCSRAWPRPSPRPPPPASAACSSTPRSWPAATSSRPSPTWCAVWTKTAAPTTSSPTPLPCTAGFAGVGGGGGRFRGAVADRPPVAPSRPAGSRTGPRHPAEACSGPGVRATSPTPISPSPPTASGSAGTWTRSARPGLRDYRPVVAGGQALAGAATEVGVDPSAGGAAGLPVAVRPTGNVVDAAVAAARPAGPELGGDVHRPSGGRVLEGAADALARRRGDLLAVMAFDAAKTVREGDPEVSEAIDFAAYYADHIPGSGERLPASRHRGRGLAVELPPVHPGRRRPRPPWPPATP